MIPYDINGAVPYFTVAFAVLYRVLLIHYG